MVMKAGGGIAGPRKHESCTGWLASSSAAVHSLSRSAARRSLWRMRLRYGGPMMARSLPAHASTAASRWTRRRWVTAAAACLAGCASRTPEGAADASPLLAADAQTLLAADAARPPAWEAQLRGPRRVLLGEVHDNPIGLARRTAALQRAVDAGWRPVVLMEQFDTDRQAALDDARARAPDDVDAWIAAAGGSGWHWPSYRGVLLVARQAGLRVQAANLSRQETRRLVREPYDAVFGAARAAALRLDRPPPADWQAGQEDEVRRGHCNALPPAMLPGMARAQFARDAVMAEALRTAGEGGAVLLAGNGHVRRDLGVPRWWTDAGAVLAVGYVEPDDGMPGEAYDARVVTAPPRDGRGDPCAGLR